MFAIRCYHMPFDLTLFPDANETLVVVKTLGPLVPPAPPICWTLARERLPRSAYREIENDVDKRGAAGNLRRAS